MTRIILKLFFLLITSSVSLCSLFAQSPEAVNYQAVIRNNKGELLVNQNISMRVSILANSANGDAIYTELHTPTSNANGLISIEIGKGATSDVFSSINWGQGIFYIKTETDLNGGNNYTIVGTSQLLSVPYALHAKTAEGLSGDLNETDPAFTAWDKSTGITISTSQISDIENITIEEKDGDVTNEIQDLSLTGNILKITRNGEATSIDLSKYLDNVDTKLSETEVDNIVSAKGYAKTSDLNDNDASNEIQDLTLTDNILKITSNGAATSIDLGKYLDNTQLSETEVDNIVSAKGYAKTSDLNDNDASNEIQDLSLIGNILKVTLNGAATSIDLSKYLDDTNLSATEINTIVADQGYAKTSELNDNDATNEIQDLSLIGNILKVTLNGSATSIDLSKYLDDTNLSAAEINTIVSDQGYAKTSELNDNDATNEIQDLSLTGNILKVTLNGSATSIDLSKYLDDTNLSATEINTIVADQGYAKTSELNDNDATNEIQDLSLTGNILKVTLNGSATSIDLSKYLDDTNLSATEINTIVADQGYAKTSELNDNDATNEIQDLSLTGDILKVTLNGSATSIDLGKYLDDTNLSATEINTIVSDQGYAKTSELNDNDATNEIQDLTLTGNDLKVTGNALATTIGLVKYLDNTNLSPTQVDAIVSAKGYVKSSDITTKADLDSPSFIGTPQLPTGTIAVTQTAGNNSTKVATTAYVENAVASGGSVSDATASTKGVIKLAGNIGGTADAPKLVVPNNTNGDLLYHNGTEWLRIAAGSDGQVLQMTSGIPQWVNASSSGSGSVEAEESVTRIVKGEINSAGGVVSGSGFSTTKNGSNDYIITFNESFSEKPVIVSNIVSASPNYFTIEIKSITTSSCIVKIIDPVNGSIMTSGFTFIVMGTK
ncbi:hypothetical protein K5X82_07100 [Halosquirtibacter xylanolyticus]|uniref:beta strand repeat-containing protein n=1 Tax=Halosquirtibacter xylanolyticus TaxID=3374599 RepID=UPI003749D1D1|nr:hypothetical protein K5X82_07100 [Prolixibacteraceae bacterium]